MDKMKQITSKEEFLAWAKNVNFSTERKQNGICDLQDVFVRGQDADMKDLISWYIEVTQTERQLLTFSIIKAMGEETCFRFLKAWARKQANICIEENQQEVLDGYAKLDTERNAFTKEKGEIERELSNQNITINELKDALKLSRINNDGLHTTVARLQETIDTQTRKLDEAYKELNKANQFKAYLKTVIGDNQEVSNQIA